MTMAQICETLKCGRVCRVCDRKFFLRATYQEYADDIIKLDLHNDILQAELNQKEQELLNSQEETKEYESMIHDEEEHFKEVAADNKRKLEELQEKQSQLNTENEVLSQKLISRKATTTDLRKQIMQAELEVEQLKQKLRSEQQKLKMAADELKDVEKNLDEIKMRSTISLRQSTLTNQESIGDINASGRYYQTVVEQKIADKAAREKRNRTVKFPSAELSKELVDESSDGGHQTKDFYMSNADEDEDYRKTMGGIMSDAGRSTQKSKKEVQQLRKQQADQQPCCGGKQCNIF